ncbi:MAG: chemotaxis protein, partial [Alphaproteobacteria bacterium]
EDAATRIMECAEAIMEADASDPQGYMEAVNAQVMKIFEACAFQDITGQRISKARENLDSIGTRVSRFASALGTERDEVAAPASEAEKAREERKRKLILNGPAAEGEGVNQDEIDALLNS